MVLPSSDTSTPTGRMSQTPIERLRDYLAQLPPQSQALLMREFERAIERGEETTIATLVLEQLRRVVRGPEAPKPAEVEEDREEGLRRRSGEAAGLLFRPLDPFLVGGNSVRPGQIRRSSLLPVWQWLGRGGAPEQVREYEATLERSFKSGSSHEVEASVRKLQLAAADVILKIAGPSPGGDKQRALSRVGAPNVIEDLLPMGAVLQAREGLDSLNGRLPSQLRVFAD